MTVSDLLIKTMKKIGVIASGETPSAGELQDALLDLQMMLRSWAAKKINVYATVSESKALTGNQALYTWGTAGNITTERPYEVVSAYVRDSAGTDFLLGLISKNEYNSIINKATTGRPSVYYYNPTYPLGSLYLYPTPDISYTLYIDTIKPFTETSSFSLTSDTLSFPPMYQEPIIYNLAVRLATEYGKTISSEVAALASSTYNTLINLNSNNQIEPCRLNLPAGMVSTYDINQGG